MKIFELSEQQHMFKKSIHKFAKKELAQMAAYYDLHEEFPWDSVKKMSEIGLTGLRLPREYGGTEADLITMGIALEEVARFDHQCAVVLCSSNITGRVLLHASQNIRDAWLASIACGESIIAFASTEPEAGSDTGAIRTMAECRDDRYIVSGEKSMISFAGVAQAYITLVKEKGGIICLFIEADSPGIAVQPLRSFGWRASGWGSIAFDSVEVPAANLIGGGKDAVAALRSTVQEQRTLTGIIALGTAEESLDQSIEYAKTRYVFGKPLGKFEDVQFKIVDDFTSLEATKLICYKALSLIEAGSEEAPAWAAMSNLMGGDVAFKVINNSMDIHGGLGYSRDMPFERYLRDVKAIQLANATLKFEIGQSILGEGFLPYA